MNAGNSRRAGAIRDRRFWRRSGPPIRKHARTLREASLYNVPHDGGFYTRGLKIRLPINYAFGLMARLDPAVRPFTVLKTTEALENLPGALAVVVAVGCFLFRFDAIVTAICVFIACFAGRQSIAFGMIPPGGIKLGLVYSNLSGYGLIFGLVVLVGYLIGGYKSVLAYVGGRVVAGMLNQLMESWNGRRMYREIGTALWGSETNFLIAYRWHASRLGKTTDLASSPEEVEAGEWKTCLLVFASQWPVVAQRFTDE